MSKVPHVWLARAALCALTALPYANTFDAGFVFDSRAIILDDPRIRAVSAANIRAIAGQSYWGSTLESPLYRPATTSSFLVNYAVLGNRERPAGYHAVNLLLHVCNVLLVFAIGLRLAGAMWAAAAVAALWAVHPLLTEAVTNLVGRADLLAGLGVLGAFYAYLRSGESRRRVRWLTLSVASTALAVFSKESGVAAIGIIVLYDLLLRRPAIPIARLVPAWVLLSSPLALFLVMRAAIPTAGASEFAFVDNPISGAGYWTGLVTALSVSGRYLWLLAWPSALSPDYSYAQVPIFDGRQQEWLALLTVAAAGLAVWWMGRANRLVLFLAAAAVVAFLPVSNLFFPTGTIMAERLMYLPASALIACVAVMGSYPFSRAAWKRGTTPFLTVVVVLLAWTTWTRNPAWRSERALWTSAIQVVPNSFKAHSSLAEALYQADPERVLLAEAAAEADRSIAIVEALAEERRPAGVYRQAASYHLELGDRFRQAGSASESTAAYRRSAELLERYLALLGERPSLAAERADGQRMLSAALLHSDDRAGAIDAARLALTREPFNAVNYRTAAAALVKAGRLDDAAVMLSLGVMLTGNADLRAASLDLYRAGLDSEGCAITTRAGAAFLNPQCAVVRRHICAAAAEAIKIQGAAGRRDLADAIQKSVVVDLGCR